MSVDLLTKYKDPQQDNELLPISGRSGFTKYWDPIIKELNLKLLNQGSHDLLEILPNLDDFLNELQIFRNRVSELTEVQSDNVYSGMLSKCDEIIQFLEMTSDELDTIEWITFLG